MYTNVFKPKSITSLIGVKGLLVQVIKFTKWMSGSFASLVKVNLVKLQEEYNSEFLISNKQYLQFILHFLRKFSQFLKLFNMRLKTSTSRLRDYSERHNLAALDFSAWVSNA